MNTMKVSATLFAALVFGIAAADATPLLIPVNTVKNPAVVAPVVVPVQAKLLSTYRAVRTFWLSRAIVR